MPAPFAILQIDHIVLLAADPLALERFYVDVLGCTVVKRQEQYKLVHLRAGSALIDIVAADPEPDAQGGRVRPAPNLDHVCLRVEPFDPDQIRTHLDRHGVTYEKVGDRFGAEGRGPSLYIADPEGNRIELKGPSGQR